MHVKSVESLNVLLLVLCCVVVRREGARKKFAKSRLVKWRSDCIVDFLLAHYTYANGWNQWQFKLLSGPGYRRSTSSLGTGGSKFITRKSGLQLMWALLRPGSLGTRPKHPMYKPALRGPQHLEKNRSSSYPGKVCPPLP
ncbi:hypothetical protein TNCV_3632461 [Trichonephila clavipes]|nr:hypothetical protein TNCV_3632461 [Trichonephila clavipes]